MKHRDYLWCALNLMLDDEEQLGLLCPPCRMAAEEERCPVCGARGEEASAAENEGFDMARFAALRKGEAT